MAALMPVRRHSKACAESKFAGAEVAWLFVGGITNNAYIFFVGMLMAQFTFTGYDACASEPPSCHKAQK
jgi:hypothetical protein